ncbi:MAG: DNA polymerase III subunit alpha [Candidatus Rokubacteria bacterium]|nr:DNA polymerase III subunit alpha [Candidatus Rokubacteria bacterium]
MTHSDFVHLHVHSEYSLLDGASHLDKLVAKAKELRFPALALTDHGNLFAAIEFYLACQRAGVKPLIGAELYVAPGSRFERANVDGSYEGANHCTVLVRSLPGYRNLMKLVSKAYLEGFYYKPRVDKELLAQHSDGLLVLSGCLNSEVSRLLAQGEEDKARQVAGWFQEVFGRDCYFMEVQSHGLPEQARVTEATLRIARAVGAPVAATNDAHYLEAAHARAHEALLCIQTGTTIRDPDRWRFSTDQFYLKSAEEMRRVFAELPEACRNTLSVAERCNLELTFGQFHLPRYRVPEGHTLESYLRHLAREGLRSRYGAPPPDLVVERLEQELAVIEKMGFAGYFLVVWDFIRYAKSQGIAVGPGRGSSAGSLVAYVLGITNIDPIRYGLLFERFLNPERISMPDMDIDFADDRRDEVIEYVAGKYGRENVAQIITFGTLGAKAAIRDVGRVLGMPYNEVDRIAKLVPAFPLNITLDDALSQSPSLAEAIRSRPELAELWEVAKSLEGLTRHASKHAAGVVISDEPLVEHVPLYKDPKRNEVVTGYAMGPIEKIGLLKMDFLGLRTLTVLANTARLVRASTGVAVDLDAIPFDDPKSYQLLSEGKTFGVFQLESAGMREALKKLKPERLEDIIAMVSLYRPGPMDLIPEFINRRHGRAKITYEHPLMEKYLKDTYGIMVYQESVMQIASEMAGFSMGEADILRRAMGKKDRELMARQRAKFIEGAKARAIGEKKAEKVFDLMEKFAGYGFNKCLTGDTQIAMADGTEKPIIEIRAGDLVLTKDGPFKALGVRPSGLRRVGRLRLANGMSVRCTPDHPLWTQRGWINAEDLTDADFVAVARQLPRGIEAVPPHKAALLGYALSEGSLGYDSHFYLYSRIGDTVSLPGARSTYARFQELMGPHLIGKRKAGLAALAASYNGMRTLLARGTVDVIPLAICLEPLRQAILKRSLSLKAGCRALGVSSRLVAKERKKRGIRRDTLKCLAERLDSPELHALGDPAIGWSRPRRFVAEGFEPTYDFEVPGAKSFVANGIVVHNSHGTAYAVVAYQTAYFKANHPVEFMAALLTSEMGDTDKIVTYIEECRAMGIQVLPPDVNVPGLQFSVVKETIRFGLAAIKNVGEAAIQSILATREAKGRFESLTDFCARVDLRLVNRRVIESLIKAGAFDSLGVSRAHLLSTLDRAMETGQRRQRDRQEGQGSFFDVMGTDDRATPDHPRAEEEVIPEWEGDQRLAYEKDVLGFYLSGHPLARFGAVTQRLGATPIADLVHKAVGARVGLVGQVTALKEIPTKSGDRMAFATLEDMGGSVELTVFPAPFKIAATLLRSREPIVVRGRVDETDKGRVVLAEDIRPLEGQPEPEPPADPFAGAPRPEPQTCRIRVPGSGEALALLESVKRLCAEHPGRVPLFLHLLLPEHEVVVRVTELSVDPAHELVGKVETLLGQGSVLVEYAGRA